MSPRRRFPPIQGPARAHRAWRGTDSRFGSGWPGGKRDAGGDDFDLQLGRVEAESLLVGAWAKASRPITRLFDAKGNVSCPTARISRGVRRISSEAASSTPSRRRASRAAVFEFGKVGVYRNRAKFLTKAQGSGGSCATRAPRGSIHQRTEQHGIRRHTECARSRASAATHKRANHPLRHTRPCRNARTS